MRKLFGILAVGALVLAGGTASAAPVGTTGTITVNLGALGSFSVSGSGSVDITGAAGSFSGSTQGPTGSQILVPSGLAQITGSPLTLIIDPNDTTVVSKVVLQPGVGNGAGTFFDSHTPGTRDGLAQTCPTGSACVAGGGKGGVMPLVGTITLQGVPILGDVAVNLQDFNVGDGGAFSAVLGGLINVTGSAAPWTTQSAQVSTATGVATVSGDGNDPITFVTPTFLNVLNNALPITTSFSLSGIKMAQAVPEPGTLLLLGSGIAGLALASRRRR